MVELLEGHVGVNLAVDFGVQKGGAGGTKRGFNYR